LRSSFLESPAAGEEADEGGGCLSAMTVAGGRVAPRDSSVCWAG
jgi:hypothetical protein